MQILNGIEVQILNGIEVFALTLMVCSLLGLAWATAARNEQVKSRSKTCLLFSVCLTAFLFGIAAAICFG